ncbi:MAG: molecular chaperone TorD family protein [Deltaproteobacteria bacterium]|nr:molecular chaperone TorD family protein [Deltaproteobacteria bacterium]
MTADLAPLGDTCRLLGRLLLEGASTSLLDEIRQQELFRSLGERCDGKLGETLKDVNESLQRQDTLALSREYTRLFVANAVEGKRQPILVPPWEDCHLGSSHQVMGERSRAVFQAYVAAELGFDDMLGKPADHIGLELLFVAALIHEELGGERDTKARESFCSEHLEEFAKTIGERVAGATHERFWRGIGDAVATLPAYL